MRKAGRTVERRLRLRLDILRQAEDELRALLSEVDGLTGRGIDPTGGRRQQGAASDRTARQAARLAAARTRVERCRAWIVLYNDVSRTLGDGYDGHVFDLTIGDGLSDLAASRKLGCDRYRVIRSRKDTMQLCVVMAVERGLVRISSKDGRREAEGHEPQA